MGKNRPWPYFAGGLICCLLLLGGILLPLHMASVNQKAVLNKREILPLEQLPQAMAPAPLSQEALVERALQWLHRGTETANLVNRQEDSTPGEGELSLEKAQTRLEEQLAFLRAYGVFIPAGEPSLVYYRLAHAITQDYQGFYQGTIQGEGTLEVTLDANTGTILACRCTCPQENILSLTQAFQDLWNMEAGDIVALWPWERMARLQLEYQGEDGRSFHIVQDWLGEEETQWFIELERNGAA